MRSAVRTYALEVDVPEELPRHAIQPAAGHFARGCAVCHGAPGEPQSPLVNHMLPRPPDLTKVGEWTDGQLFRIVKHGVRFTGMPAWPTQNRDDEVWAMVAFLRELPSMDEVAWRDLAYDGSSPALTPENFDQALAECARCHGGDGLGRSPVTPIIAGQSEAYLLENLRAYSEGRRSSGVMALPTAAVDAEVLDALARHFAAMPAPERRYRGRRRACRSRRGHRPGRPVPVERARVPGLPRWRGEEPALSANRRTAERIHRRAASPVPRGQARRNVLRPSDDECGEGP
jgi:cytochrome c553